ncbi:DNA-processing protein DprA [Paenibacillus sacheonensis]|uniref:DNA-protecting protein DprA n=1 Tax=Paenibacillus sacheonensis TaxID=742054 RepID=A0A7X4YML5_9BACL|nr:DNA-processing protein DprA [Paenibacillus sacheonensis]MBM7564598.1 DNA processing protein [Paenibacillus sacheonensis]NBC69155.1 DNA-protecting protein DprA [Paenibacillus sacheonensis]
MNETKKKNDALITLHETPGIGWQSIRKAVECGQWTAYERYAVEAWVSAVGLKPEQARALANAFATVDPLARQQAASLKGVTLITYFDEAYPDLLRQSPQPPWVVYAIGRLDLLQKHSIAIVGTRNPTSYGRKTASMLGRELSESGITVVSGLARGVDAMAHEGALNGHGGTIAVLGTPVERVYPAENRFLYDRIAKQGLILSEVPPGTPFHPGLFPLRNRIIAGLSLGTVVVEAAERSGSLITADQALEMSRDVFAVPGPVSSPKSAGTNGLIRQGAKLVGTCRDILEEYEGRYDFLDSTGSEQPNSAVETDISLTEEEAFIYRLLQDEARTTDELHELTSFPFGLLHSVLINLTIKRKIEQHPGSIYSVL